jgi:uncharacterized membrane protein (DUF106 family)
VSPIAFLLIAVVVGAIGSLFVVVRNRQVRHPHHAMDEFQREMKALAPRDEESLLGEQAARFPFRPDDVSE